MAHSHRLRWIDAPTSYGPRKTLYNRFVRWAALAKWSLLGLVFITFVFLFRPDRVSGRWPSLAVGPLGTANGRVAIAFADLSAQQLLIYQSDTLTAHAAHANAGDPGLIHVVDNGRAAAGEAWRAQTFPGVQTSIAFTSTGKIALAYQDATPVDLMLSIYDPLQAKSTSRTTVRPTGAAGFWPRIAIASNTAYLSSATVKAVTAAIPFNPLFVDAMPAQ